MKVSLNMKSGSKVYQRINWPIITAFALTIVISILWVISLNATHRDLRTRTEDFEARRVSLAAQLEKNENMKKMVENKQFINNDTLAGYKQKIEYLGKFTGQKPSVYAFFQSLEDAVTGETFLTKIYAGAKNNEINIEGLSSGADNITELVKKLQAQPHFKSVDLKQITGDRSSQQKNLRFAVTFAYDHAALLEFPLPTEKEGAATEKN